MRRWRLAATVAVLLVALQATGAPSRIRAQSATSLPYRVVSDSYYRVDPAAGTMTARVEATFYNRQTADLKALPIWVMPAASSVLVTQDGSELKTTITQASAKLGIPALVLAQLPTPLKANLRTDVVVTYAVPAQSNALVNMAPGVVESPFVSQGQGSFVFVDVPKSAENYFDPGCIAVASQPKDVTDAGYERWVCGEIIHAVFGRTDSTEAACANLDDRCRQRTLKGSVVAFAQSITDPSSRGTASADVQLSQKSIRLTFRYFKHDEQWALKEMETAKTALPRLEALFGFPFPFDSLSLRESHHIEFGGAAGLAYLTGGDILVAPGTGIDDEVAVHELAHEWAGGNLAETWEAEGLAEYAMRSLAPDMSIKPSDWGWQKLGYTDNLATWGDGSAVADSDYWYGKASAFFFALEQAVGGKAKMTEVLSKLDPHLSRTPFDGRYLMDRAEAVSGANLDDLFLKWVFNPAAAAGLLKERRAAYTTLKPLTDRAAAMGLAGVPLDIQANLDAWSFGGIEGQAAQGNKVLDSYATVVAQARDNGLENSGAVAKSWGSDTMAHTSTVIEDERLAIAAITSAAEQLAGLHADPPALKQLEDARAKFASGDFAEAKRLASGAVAAQFNGVAAGKLIELAKQKQASFSPSFLSRVGLLFMDPAGDLAAAEKAYAAGDSKTALALSRSAYDGWNDAGSRGLQRLAVLAGVMCALSVGIWYLLRRLQRPPNEPGGGQQGHFIEPARFNWHDWENPR